MATTSPAEKSHRREEARRIRNRAVRHQVRSTIRSFELALSETGEGHSVAEGYFRSAGKLLDSAVSKGVYKRNTAARTKSRLSKRLASAVSK